MVKSVAIIPAYNEEVALGSIILRTLQYVDEVIIVNDGSDDKTVDVAKLAGAEIINHATNLGKGEALKSGFSAIGDADVVVTIDADGQHNPDEIPSLIKPIIEDYRRVGQQVLDNATNISAGIKVTDSQSGFRAFSPAACKVFRFYDTGFGIESEMLVDVAEAGLKIVEVPITVRYDVDGSTKNPVTHGVGVLLKIIKDKIFRTFKK